MSLRQRQPRQRDEKHLDYIRSLPCCICGEDTTVEAAHIRMGSIKHGKNPTGLQEKPDDRWAVPMCGKHHRLQHTVNEQHFWDSYGLNPFEIALSHAGREPVKRAEK